MKPGPIVVLLVLCCHSSPATAQAGKLLPVDQALQQAEFFTFRARLLSALARRDTLFLLSTVAPEIRNSFGDDNGADAFRGRWRLEAQDSELWGELTTVLALGGTFLNDSTFVAPYVFSRWPAGFDSFEYVAVIGSDVRVRSEANMAAPALQRVSFELVQRARASGTPRTDVQDDSWEAVQLRDGQTGYVSKEYLRSPVDYRAIFVRRRNAWTMIAFIAGD